MTTPTEHPPISSGEVFALAGSFERSADWLDKGEIHGPARTHPLVGIADYRRAAYILKASAFLWATNESEV